MAVGDRDQLLGPIGADTHDDQGTQACLLQADVEVHAVGPAVHVVDVVQAPIGELLALLLPGRGQPGDHRRRQPGGGAEELLEGGDEVAELIPCRYMNGSTSATLGLLRHHGA